MIKNPQYVLDTNIFIEAAKRYYAFDLVPAFWDALIQNSLQERIISIDRVRHELERGKDELAEWITNKFGHAFASTSVDSVISEFADIMSWVQSQGRFIDAAKAAFADGADGWLIAYAKANGCVVVTQEVPDPNIRRQVKIPDVCQAFKVKFVNTFEMLRAMEIKFR